MARPQKTGLDYFPHDVYASSDEKIEPLLLLYGAKGYGFYFLHLEYIYRNSDLEFDISDAETREVICQKLRISDEEYNQILITALKKNCFDKKTYEEKGKLTSNGVKKRASTVIEKREKMRLSYEQKISAAETTHIKESKVKKSKGKESKKDIGERTALENAMDDFKEYRMKIKKPMTDRAVQLLYSELNRLSVDDETKIAILNQSIVNGWQGVFALKEPAAQKNNTADNGGNVFFDMLRKEGKM